MLRLQRVALLPLSILLATACGDDDAGGGSEASVAQYFADFATISDDGQAQIAELGDKYPDAFEGDVQQTQDSYGEYIVIFDDTVSLWEALNVPEELKLLHDEVIEANSELSAINHQRLDRLGDASSPEEVDDVFFAEGPELTEFTDAVARTDSVCEELE